MIQLEIALKTVSESNLSEHWSVSSKRHRRQQYLIKELFRSRRPQITLPCTITLVRISRRFLDAEDNLPMAFKWIKDEIGAQLFPDKVVKFSRRKRQNGDLKEKKCENKGHADSDPRVIWKYSQEKGKIQGIRIEFS